MFNGPSFQSYYSQVDRFTNGLLDKEPAAKLLIVDPDEYLDHLVSELEWRPLEWYEARKTIEPFIKKVSRRSEWDRGQTIQQDVPKFLIRIPCSPHPQRSDYLKLSPSQFRLSGEPDWRFEGDVLVLEVDATAEAVEKGLDEVRFWLGGRNSDIEQGNGQLRQRIAPIWDARRRRLEEQNGQMDQVIAKLGIPVHRPDRRD